MLRPILQFWRFLTSMDAKTGRAVAVTVGLFATVALVFFFGKTELGRATEGSFEAWLTELCGQSLGFLPAAIFVFTAASFIGAPQFVPDRRSAWCFASRPGGNEFFRSWIATVISAAANFFVGRWAGAKALEQFGGETANRLSGYVGQQ